MVFGICYGIGFGAFAALILLMLLKRLPEGFGFRVLVVCVITAAWAATAALQVWWSPGFAHVMDSVRSAAWLLLIISILAEHSRNDHPLARARWLPVLAVLIGGASVVNDLRFLLSTSSPTAFASSQILWRVIVSIFGILSVENLIRNTPANRKWHVFPFCIAVGALFAYDLFVFSEAVILRQISGALLAGRGIVLAMIVPLLALTMARNPEWRVDIHVSRRIVFHSATLMAAGIFLVLAAGVAILIGHFPGEWAPVSEVAFLCGSVVLLAFVLSTESFRARIRRVISENFFSTRYDYRVEWLRCIATLSAGNGGEALSVRAIRAIADVVDSPGGVLWVENGCGRYHVERCLNMPMDMNASEIESEQFIQRFQKGTVVQVFETSETSGPNHSPVPPWANETSVPWLAIPLVRVDQTIGFVVLALPRTPMTLNWESFDLLLAIGQQVAGYLSEDRATRSLLESKSLIDFSQKFSFVVHDIKNISGQLGMMVANIRAFGDDPEFRADLIRSLESGVRKLQALLDKLRPNSGVREDTKTANPASVIDATVRELTRGDVALWTEIAAGELSLRMDPAVLQAIITHLVTNAIEASQAGGTVVVRLREEKERAIIEIADEGCGMTPEFVRNGLFVPFKTTKERGHGVGAYQARELLRAASGDLEVFSKPGSGTTMRLLIPCVAGPTREAAEMVAAR